MALRPKIFCLKLPNSVKNAKKILEAMPLAMLPTKSLQHCQDQMIRAIGNGPNHLLLTMLQTFVWQQWPESSGLGIVVDFWLATLPMALPQKLFLHFSLN